MPAQLRQLPFRKVAPERYIGNYLTDFNRKRKPAARIAVLRRLYKYLLTIPDFIAERHLIRKMIIKKTREFTLDARAVKVKPLFTEVLALCIRHE